MYFPYFRFIVLLSSVIVLGCYENSPDYFKLGKQSFENGNYALAKNQLSMIQSSDSVYGQAQYLIYKIDSIEENNRLESSRKDSLSKVKQYDLRKKFVGNYKVEVLGTSSDKMVEIYMLNQDGIAEWLWVYYRNNNAIVDDRKHGTWKATRNQISIDIMGNSEMITEIYELSENRLINTEIPRRHLEKTTESY